MKKRVNKELVDFAIKAKKNGRTYGEQQAFERMEKEKKKHPFKVPEGYVRCGDK